MHNLITAKVKFAALTALVLCTVGLVGGIAAHQVLSSPPTDLQPPSPFVLLAASVDQRVEDWQPTRAERKFDEVGWTTNLVDGLRLAKEHNRPLFVFTHVGRMNLGRSGGAGFGMRARSLNDERIIALLNRYFVSVYLSNDDVRIDKTASVQECAERTRIYHQSLEAKFSVGDECAYFLTPAGQPFDGLEIKRTNRVQPFLEKLEEIVAKLDTPSGNPVVKPTAQSVRPATEADALVLHLSARVIGRPVWCEFPSENWIVLPRERWLGLLPAKTVGAGDSWVLDPDVSASVLTYFYPQTENNNATPDRIEAQNLYATVLSTDNGVVQARIDGSLRMKHLFYEGRPDGRFIDATIVGVLEYESLPPRIRSLRLVTERATYGEWSFGVAVRSHP